jgi:hypothetical protein
VRSWALRGGEWVRSKRRGWVKFVGIRVNPHREGVDDTDEGEREMPSVGMKKTCP